MGKVPLLSREEEVDISKRIELAETAALKIIFSFADERISVRICKKLLEREERFDRVVLDKKIDNEVYFRSLNKQVIALEALDSKIKKFKHEKSSNATQEKEPTLNLRILKQSSLLFSKNAAEIKGFRRISSKS